MLALVKLPGRRVACCSWAVLLSATALAGCSRPTAVGDIGDADRGSRRFLEIGCGACHQIRTVASANGHVGPPLDDIGERTIVAGVLPNTPPNMVRWLKNPQAVVPGNAMPNMKLSDQDARDITAYLYTLR